MKIWFPLISAGSGSDVYTTRLARSLEKYGVQTEITYFPKYFELAPWLLRGYSPPAGTDIIHSNSWSAFAFKRSGIPLITTTYHPTFDAAFDPYKSIAQRFYHRYIGAKYENLSFRYSDKIIAISRYTYNSLAHNLRHGLSEVLYCYVDTNEYRPALRREIPTDRPFRLLYVGNLSNRKGADLLPEIMAQLGDKYELTATAGLRDVNNSLSGSNIRVVGRLSQSDLVSAYQNADVLVFPSRLEGFGYSALEAMACGTPVVASRSSAIPEVVIHDETGLLCEPNNVGEFVQAIRFLKNNPDKLSQYAEAARIRAENAFPEAPVIERYIAICQELAGTGSNRQHLK
ncbi:MAG: hypothetical protein AMJ53_16060 [Gammaproteobacteria bacterium SG8_11]|nr:MAG: hypothetical protein AMJ53_16060 [Gammaproteobacteria bacterium SG8_11]